jgi:hypothetical protein
MTLTRSISRNAGFFAGDLILSLALLGMLGWLCHLGSKRAQLRQQGEMVKADLAAISQAMQQLDSESKAPVGVPVAFATLIPYLQKHPILAASGGKDAFGHKYENLLLGTPPQPPAATVETLKDVVTADFWGSYLPAVPRKPKVVALP